jgi:haloalkane dehalogenase
VTIRRGYVDTSNGQVHYRMAGEANGCVPIIMLHQTPSSSVMFEALMSSLATEYQVFAPDMPGFGGSDPLTEPVTIAAYARVFFEAFKALGIKQCWLFGHHTGASVATQLASDHPEFIKRLALSGPTLLSEQLKEILPTKSTAFPVQDDGSHLVSMWQRIKGKDTAAPLALIERETLLAISLGDAYPDAYKAVIEQDFADQLASVECPTLVFAGTEDPLFGQLDKACQLLQHGSKVVLEHGRTYTCERNVGEVTSLLQVFFID